MIYVYKLANKQKNKFWMLPISTGKSPRVDQIYTAMRSMRPLSNSVQNNSQSNEDRSIEHIRSIGHQLLSGFKSIRKKQKIIDTTAKITVINKSQQQQYDNLYDKYRNSSTKKMENIIQKRTTEISNDLRKQMNKHRKDPKYEKVNPKIINREQFSVKLLNYVKRTDKKAEQQTKIKKQSGNVANQMKLNTAYYQKYGFKNKQNNKTLGSKNPNIQKNSQLGKLNNQKVVERGEEMIKRKNSKIQKIKAQVFVSQMDGVTFTPQRISKEKQFSKTTNFTQRLQLNKINRVVTQQRILSDSMKNLSFVPKTNLNQYVDSIIKPIWDQQQKHKRHSTDHNNYNNESEQSQKQQYHHYQSEGRHADTMSKDQSETNTNSKVIVKNISQMSFIFE